MSHGLFVSNRSGSLNRSLFHCYRSRRELELRVGRVYPSLSRLLVSWTKIQGAPASTRGRCASLPWFTDPHISPPSPPLPHPLSHSLLPLPRSLLAGGSGGAHPLCTILRMHACMHACTRARAWLREPYNFYGDIIWSTLFANRPLARLVTPVIAIIDSLNRARGSDGHLLRPPVYQSRTSIRNDSILSFFVSSSFNSTRLAYAWKLSSNSFILSFFFSSSAIKLEPSSWKVLRQDVLLRNRNSI